MGDDEARARATLNEMQHRISQGPYAALGVASTALPGDVRAAFLALTKQFHPARFARMSPEVHRLSNDVFIGIKTAHEQLLKQLGVARQGGANRSGAMPMIQPEGTGRATTPQPAGPGQPPTGPYRAVASPPTGPYRAVASPPTGPYRAVASPPTGPHRAVTPPQGSAARPASAQPVRPATPAGRTPVSTTPAGRPAVASASRPGMARPAVPPAPVDYNPETIRHRGAPTFDERSAHRQAMIQLNEQDWPSARETLQALAAHRPQSKNYNALLAYARGREAQKLGRGGEAAVEYQRALELEPDLAMAKQALAELQRRR